MHRKKVVVIASATVLAGLFIFLGLRGSGSQTIPGSQVSPTPNQNNSDVGNKTLTDTFVALQDADPPTLQDPNLRVEKVVTGLALPTSMAFLDNDDVIILQKDNGAVRVVANGSLLANPLLNLVVDNRSERGLLGVAVNDAGNGSAKSLFIYYTEAAGDIRNRIYRYDLTGYDNVTAGTLILDLPGTPGPNHDGGKLVLGPDRMLYAVIGDLNRDGMLQNYKNAPEPDDTSVILRIDENGKAVPPTILSHDNQNVNATLSRYYAYGIRNSFGLDFDPVTGELWDTENGASSYDELNLVRAGFNSGWERIMGPSERTNADPLNDLVRLEGSSYADPVFSWRQSRGITDIEFLNSSKLGQKYESNIFVGDINDGNLYFFTVNVARDGIAINDISGLSDLVADNDVEVAAVTFGEGFGGITDIETGPDGYLYILSLSGDLYRILPVVRGP